MHKKTTYNFLLFFLTSFSICSALFEKIEYPKNCLNIAKVRTSNITIKNNTSDRLPITITTIKPAKNTPQANVYDLFGHDQIAITTKAHTHIQSISISSDYYGTISLNSDASLLLVIDTRSTHTEFNRTTTITDFEFDIGRHPDASKRAKKDFRLSIMENNLFTKLVMTGLYPEHLLSYFIDLYNHNHLSKNIPDKQTRIPKIIHHVWFGCPFPKQYRHWRKSWTNKHPDWIHFLWVDNPENYSEGDLVTSYAELVSIITDKKAGNYVVPCSIVFPLFHQDFFEQTSNLGERSDIFRLDMLNRFGGLYVDTDFECIESFDILNCTYDFYAGLAPLSMNKIQVANGLIASRPHHPILKAYQSEIADSLQLKHLGNIPGLFSGTPIVAATGPAPLTRAIVSSKPNKTDRNIIFPPSIFYAHRLTMREYTRAGNPFPPEQFESFPNNFALPLDSFAIHYWESSWNK